ncbi:FAD-dependent oxidoreductase [Microbacterium lacus]|uniref:NAD(P)/FAD-dependent oxidoreductase n=1 Tax=Microbacterium lacus TaxID=415217 RepID=UPI003850BF1E
MTAGVLIVGGGQAGMQVAATLRSEGFSAPITIVGAEKYAPYQRPPLSKGFLQGVTDEAGLELRADTFYSENEIEVVTAETITTASLAGDGGSALGESGRVYAFDRLVIATGASPRRLTIPGSDAAGVLYMRDIDDALELKRRWPAAESVVVIGGGFIGLEVAAAAAKDGKHVTVLEVADRLIGRAVSSHTSEFLLDWHRAHGVEVRLGARIEQVLTRDGVASAVYTNEGIVPADIVVVGIGALPRIDLAEALGLRTEPTGILVDRFALTSDPRVLAVGDVALQMHPARDEEHIRLESVQNAVDQGRIAALTIMGNEHPSHTVPWFWSDQGDMKLQIAGISSGSDEVVVRPTEHDDKFVSLYYLEGQLIAVDAVNSPGDYLTVRRALGEGRSIPAELARASSEPLKSLLAPLTTSGSL